MTTALQALIQHDWELAGLVRDDREMIQDSCPAENRIPVAIYDPEYEIYRTNPRSYEEYVSKPIRERFGDTSEIANDIPFTEEWKEKGGITPDEHVADTFIRVITGKEL